MDEKDVRIALTMGDPAGIGPEITASLVERGVLEGTKTVIIGSAAALLERLPSGRRGDFHLVEFENFVERVETAGISFPALIDVQPEGVVELGAPSVEGGRVSGKAVELAAELSSRGLVDAIVTGPVSKEALSLAGYRYRGHTEMLSALLDSPDCQMVMVAGNLKVLILTRDMPLADVPASITAGRIEKAVQVAFEGLKRWWGIERPAIAVAALNPHGGDGGVLGREEIEVIRPALEGLRERGLDVRGPFPADTLFVGWEKKGCDLFVAMYHDQGMIPFKMVGFDEGVNVTLGLPVMRTSVSHGTAYDIAGKGAARSGSLERAFELAVRCVRRNRENH